MTLAEPATGFLVAGTVVTLTITTPGVTFSIQSRCRVANHCAPLKAPPVSSPQVSARINGRRSRVFACFRRIIVSVKIAACALSSEEPRP